jgi:hypothetical protein
LTGFPLTRPGTSHRLRDCGCHMRCGVFAWVFVVRRVEPICWKSSASLSDVTEAV